MPIIPEEDRIEGTQKVIREIVQRGGRSVGFDEIGFEPSWIIEGMVEGRIVSLKEEKGKKVVSIARVVMLHSPELGERKPIAIDRTEGEIKISRDEARRIYPDTADLDRALRRARRKVVITEET